MDYFRLMSLVAGIVFVGALPAQADVNTDRALRAIDASLGFRNTTITNLGGSDREVRSASQAALNAVVAEGIFALRSNGDHRLADRYEGEWNQKFANYFTGIGALDLGDHKPLSKWLADFYVKIEDRIGLAATRSGLLGDIYLMNYAIPIVFAPKGDWRTTTTPNRDWVEYRKHFIPFANVITYWGVKLACNRLLRGQDMGNQGKKLCNTVAEKLRHAMGRYVAPKISDFVFNRANGLDARLDISASDLVYVNAADLVRELEQEGAL